MTEVVDITATDRDVDRRRIRDLLDGCLTANHAKVICRALAHVNIISPGSKLRGGHWIIDPDSYHMHMVVGGVVVETCRRVDLMLVWLLDVVAAYIITNNSSVEAFMENLDD